MHHEEVLGKDVVTAWYPRVCLRVQGRTPTQHYGYLPPDSLPNFAQLNHTGGVFADHTKVLHSAVCSFFSDCHTNFGLSSDIFFTSHWQDLLSTKGACTGACAEKRAPQEAIVQVQDAQWYQPASLDRLLALMQQLQGRDFGLVFGSTGNGQFLLDPYLLLDDC